MMNLIFWQIVTLFLSTVLVLSWYFIHILRKTLKASLAREESAYLELLDFSTVNPDPVLQINKKGILLYANPASAAILTNWNIHINDKIPMEWREILRQICLSKKPQALELGCNEKTFLLNIVPMKNECVAIYGTDITELKKIQNELTQHLMQDFVTKLPNRIIFLQNLSLEINHARKAQVKLGIFIVRLDDLKEIQNTYGSQVSDKLLMAFCERLKNFKSEEGTVARLSDNEFGLIEPKIRDPAGMVSLVQAVIEKCAAPYAIDGTDLLMTMSIGIAFFPGDGETAELLLRNAHLTVERTMRNRNQYEFFQRGMVEQLQIKRKIITDLHKVLNENQLRVYYQPQIDLLSHKMVGCEALIRWDHPKKGFISPFFFMNTAEETQLIIPIGEWILNRACLQIMEWKNQNLGPIRVAVNISATQLFQNDIVATIKSAIVNTKIPPQWLELELTESAIVQDIDKGIEIMKELKELGVGLALDDFGTGYSSLSYLMKFPVNKLKIDRSFIKLIEDDQYEKYALIKGIIELGHSLNLKIVAEGVETKVQLDFLAKHQCDMIQGYYFGQPQPAEKFVEFFKKEWKV